MLSSLAETAKQEPVVLQQKRNGAYAAFPHQPKVSDSERRRVMGFDS